MLLGLSFCQDDILVMAGGRGVKVWVGDFKLFLTHAERPQIRPTLYASGRETKIVFAPCITISCYKYSKGVALRRIPTRANCQAQCLGADSLRGGYAAIPFL